MERVYEMVELSTIPVILAKVTCSGRRPGIFQGGACKGSLSTTRHSPPKLLELSNAAHYGHSRRIQTLNEAVSLLGFEAVKGLAISSQRSSVRDFQGGREQT